MESEIHSVMTIPLTTKIRSRRCSGLLLLNRRDTSSDLKLRDGAEKCYRLSATAATEVVAV